jgi:hypothetical protein
LKTDISILSFRTGLLLLVISTLTLLAKGGSFILVFTHLLPGLFYGFVLASNLEKQRALWRKIVFILLSTAIYIFCVYKVDILNDNTSAPIRLLGYSALGSLSLKLCYDLILTGRFSFVYTLVLPIVCGLLGSAVSAGSMYLIVSKNVTNEFISTLLWIGMFTVFPFWQFLFGLNIKTNGKAAANSSFAKVGLIE